MSRLGKIYKKVVWRVKVTVTYSIDYLSMQETRFDRNWNINFFEMFWQLLLPVSFFFFFFVVNVEYTVSVRIGSRALVPEGAQQWDMAYGITSFINCWWKKWSHIQGVSGSTSSSPSKLNSFLWGFQTKSLWYLCSSRNKHWVQHIPKQELQNSKRLCREGSTCPLLDSPP